MMKRERLKNMTVIYTDTDYLINTDGPLLASFIEFKKGSRLLDLCTGNGIIPIWLVDRGFRGEAVAIDIQQDAVILLKRTIKENSLGNISALHQDMRNYTESSKFDIVCCNPPYYVPSRLPVSPNEKRAVSRFSLAGDIEDFATAARKNLKDNGSFYCCFPPGRLQDLLKAFTAVNLHLKRLRFCRHRVDVLPWVMLVEAVVGNDTSLSVLPDLIVEENGLRNTLFDEIYAMGNENEQ